MRDIPSRARVYVFHWIDHAEFLQQGMESISKQIVLLVLYVRTHSSDSSERITRKTGHFGDCIFRTLSRNLHT
jgi:hypothetical protein